MITWSDKFVNITYKKIVYSIGGGSMSFPKLTFPLVADFGSSEYWINDMGPFKYGAAVTEFFCGNDLTDNVGGSLLLMRRLEQVLQVFGRNLHPYVH